MCSFGEKKCPNQPTNPSPTPGWGCKRWLMKCTPALQHLPIEILLLKYVSMLVTFPLGNCHCGSRPWEKCLWEIVTLSSWRCGFIFEGEYPRWIIEIKLSWFRSEVISIKHKSSQLRSHYNILFIVSNKIFIISNKIFIISKSFL